MKALIAAASRSSRSSSGTPAELTASLIISRFAAASWDIVIPSRRAISRIPASGMPALRSPATRSAAARSSSV